MGQLFKNVASQKVRVFAFADAGHATLDPGEPVTGDAANISAYTAADNAALGASNDVAPTEVDATNAPGFYEFDPTAGETNGDVVEWYPKSSTAGVQVVTVGGNVQTTQPQYLPDFNIASDGDFAGNVDGTVATVTTLTGHTAQTGDSYARIGAAGASLTDLGGMSTAMKAEVNAEADTALSDYDPPTKTEMDTAFTEIKGATWASGTDTLEHIRNKQTDIETDTQDLQTQVGTAGAGLTDLGGMSTAMKAEVNAEADTAISDAALATAAALSTAQTDLDTLTDRLILVTTTIATLASQTSFTLTAGSTDNDAYNGCVIVVEDASTAAQKCIGYISDYTGATKTVTLVADPAVFTIAATDKVSILARNAADVALVTGVAVSGGTPDVNVTQISGDSVAADNAEAFFDGTGYAGTNNVIPTVTTLTGHTAQTGDNYARIGAPAGASVSADVAAVKVDTAATLVDTGTTIPATLGTPVADLATDIAGVQTDTTAIVADTNELQTDWADGGRLDALIDSIVSALTGTLAEATGVPAATASMQAKLNYVFLEVRNKITQTATTKTVFADDGSTTVASATVSDDGTTFTKGELS